MNNNGNGSANLRFPLVFAHRGANTFAPENSLAAFEEALRMGCDGIELDVRLCASGEVVVFHDRNTFRMTGVRASIQKISYQKIRTLNLHCEKGGIHRIPTLPEVLELAGKDVLINIDVKKESLLGTELEEKILAHLYDFGVRENVIISSFNPRVIKKIAALDPHIHLGFIYRSRSHVMMLNGTPVHSLHVRHRILSRRYVRQIHRKYRQVFAWTVDDINRMLDMVRKDVDAIITNKPELFFQLKSLLTEPLPVPAVKQEIY